MAGLLLPNKGDLVMSPKHGKVPFQKVPFQNRGSGVRNRDLGYPESEVRIWEFRGQDSGIRNQDFGNPVCELQKP